MFNWQDHITTGQSLSWGEYEPFYHVTPKSRLPQITSQGLILPSPERQALLGYIQEPEPVPGIYLSEDKDMILYAIAGTAMERGFPEPLSLLKVWVKNTVRWTSDPDGPPGTIVVLENIPPELVWVEIDEITLEMIPEEP